MRALVLTSTLALGLLLSEEAVAQGSPGARPDPTTADGWNARGVRHRMDGEHVKALEAFRQADSLAPGPRSRGQLGFVEHDLGQYAAAERHLTEALEAETDPWIVKNRKVLVEALELCRRHLGSIVLGGGEPGANVTVRGEPAGVLPLQGPLRVVKGEALIGVRAPGRLPWSTQVTVVPGKTQEIVVDLVPDRRELPDITAATPVQSKVQKGSLNLGVASPQSREPTGAAPRSRIFKWSVIGVGVATAAAGVVYLAATRQGCGSVECRRLPPSALPGIVGIGAGVVLVGGATLYSW